MIQNTVHADYLCASCHRERTHQRQEQLRRQQDPDRAEPVVKLSAEEYFWKEKRYRKWVRSGCELHWGAADCAATPGQCQRPQPSRQDHQLFAYLRA